MIGIYKITNPENKIYIGQSINIEKRFKQYKKLDCKYQVRIYESLMFHGVENHVFEIVKECSKIELNNAERYYQDLYDCISNNGLNCSLTRSDSNKGKVYPSTMLKMRGRKNTAEHFKKIILDTETGIFYFGATEAAEVYSLNSGTLRSRLCGQMINNTNLIYV